MKLVLYSELCTVSTQKLHHNKKNNLQNVWKIMNLHKNVHLLQSSIDISISLFFAIVVFASLMFIQHCEDCKCGKLCFSSLPLVGQVCSFLVRPSDSTPGDYSLFFRTNENIQRFKICPTPNNQYMMGGRYYNRYVWRLCLYSAVAKPEGRHLLLYSLTLLGASAHSYLMSCVSGSTPEICRQ